MFVEEGIYKVIGTIVVAVFLFILVCRLLGYQSQVIEGLTSRSESKRNGSNKQYKIGEGNEEGTNKQAAEYHKEYANDNIIKSKAGHGDLRSEQEDQIIKLEKRILSEVLHAVIDKKQDKHGNWVNPLLTQGNIIDNNHAMVLITKLNELCKFRDTLEVAINTLDNTDATSISMD